jgi:glycosyltransferase involved in cell wall biosynthesis
MSSLRVALDYRPALLGRSGIPRAVRELARALAEHAPRLQPPIEVHLFGHSLAAVGHPDHPPTSRLHRARLPGRALPWLARLGASADRLAGNAAIFHWTDYVFPPVSRRTRVVMTLHDCAFVVDPSWHGEDAATLRERTVSALERADAIVCPTLATAADAETHLGISRDRLRVIPFGADHALRWQPTAAAVIPRDYLLMVGTLEPRKNHARVFAAVRALGDAAPLLVVCGRAGWCCEPIVDELRRLVAEGRALWIENADDDALVAWLTHARALLYPSLLEGFGFPPLEALALGVPVVVGDVPALRETCGTVADYCDPRSVESIAATMVDVSARGRDESADRRRRDHAANHRWSDTAIAHLALYAELSK